MSLQLRNYNDADFPLFQKMLKDIGIYHEPLDTRDILRKKIEHDSESIIVAEDKGRLVGTVFILYDPWCSFVYHLGVHPDYRGKRLATQLMDEAEGKLKARGIKRPTLFVEEDNQEVVEFYNKRGWFVLYKVFCLEKQL